MPIPILAEHLTLLDCTEDLLSDIGQGIYSLHVSASPCVKIGIIMILTTLREVRIYRQHGSFVNSLTKNLVNTEFMLPGGIPEYRVQ